MLRNAPIVMTTQLQAFMVDKGIYHPPQNQNDSSFLTSPKFKGLITQNHPGNEFLCSPSTILDNRTFSPLTNPSWYDKINHLKSPPGILKSPGHSFSETKDLPENMDSGPGIGLKLIDTLVDETARNTSSSKVCNKRVLFGSNLRVEIPQLSKAQPEFTIDTQHSQDPACGLGYSNVQTERGCKRLCVSEIELSEEYTCVTTHGLNPRTTHIYDNCIVESYYSLSNKQKNPSTTTDTERDFLSFCHTCKRSLEQVKDIHMYRGEKAFRSDGCRYHEMLVDGVESPELGDKIGRQSTFDLSQTLKISKWQVNH